MHVLKTFPIFREEVAEPAAATSADDQFADAEVEGDETSNDFMLAQMLQRQFNEEHDKQLKREEAKYNGPSKGVYYSILYHRNCI